MNRQGVGRGCVILLATLALTVLNGCGGVLITPYGNVAKDGDDTAITMPAGAPTIFHGYYPRPAGSLTAGGLQYHEAIDIFAEEGTPVLAPAAGTVVYSEYDLMIGNTLIIEHGTDDSGRVLITKYQHLQGYLVQEGDRVERGQQIGLLGMSGALSAAIPHLHFETRIKTSDSVFTDTEPINPHSLWVQGTGRVSCYDTAREYPARPIRLTYPVTCRPALGH
jgi:murein DD-endopeptidase MepM/ murein hydrolase activator NlpD